MLTIFEELSPHARVLTAVLPFLIVMVIRILYGRNRTTRILVSLGTMWFVTNVLMAPNSIRMRRDIHELRYIFR